MPKLDGQAIAAFLGGAMQGYDARKDKATERSDKVAARRQALADQLTILAKNQSDDLEKLKIQQRYGSAQAKDARDAAIGLENLRTQNDAGLADRTFGNQMALQGMRSSDEATNIMLRGQVDDQSWQNKLAANTQQEEAQYTATQKRQRAEYQAELDALPQMGFNPAEEENARKQIQAKFLGIKPPPQQEKPMTVQDAVKQNVFVDEKRGVVHNFNPMTGAVTTTELKKHDLRVTPTDMAAMYKQATENLAGRYMGADGKPRMASEQEVESEVDRMAARYRRMNGQASGVVQGIVDETTGPGMGRFRQMESEQAPPAPVAPPPPGQIVPTVPPALQQILQNQPQAAAMGSIPHTPQVAGNLPMYTHYETIQQQEGDPLGLLNPRATFQGTSGIDVPDTRGAGTEAIQVRGIRGPTEAQMKPIKIIPSPRKGAFYTITTGDGIGKVVAEEVVAATQKKLKLSREDVFQKYGLVEYQPPKAAKFDAAGSTPASVAMLNSSTTQADALAGKLLADHPEWIPVLEQKGFITDAQKRRAVAAAMQMGRPSPGAQ